MEAEAKLHIQEEICNGTYDLVWSFMNEYENTATPCKERQRAVDVWENRAAFICKPNRTIYNRGIVVQKMNIKPKDALHIACAVDSGCTYFITTDIALVKKAQMITEIAIINPIDFVRIMEGKNDSR